MPRLFTGLEIPDNLVTELSMLRGGLSGARWIEPEDYHLTLRFVGDIGRELANEIADGLDGIRLPPIDITLDHFAVFGADRPRALIARAVDSAVLMALQAEHERLMRKLGISDDGRKFTPHVTLARLKDPDPVALHGFIASHNLYKSRVFEVGRFVLFSSRPSRGGGPYAVEESYQLQAGP